MPPFYLDTFKYDNGTLYFYGHLFNRPYGQTSSFACWNVGNSHSLLICSYGFSQATYQLDQKKITAMNLEKLDQLDGITSI